jgi:transposase InsO family protein
MAHGYPDAAPEVGSAPARPVGLSGGRRSPYLVDSLKDARLSIEHWRLDYNKNRPHSSLDDLAPEQFVARVMGF